MRRTHWRRRCLGCGKGFSRQTFRHDYRDRRPECNAPLFTLVNSGVGLRQIGRVLGLDIKSVQRKHRKIARTCEPLHANLAPSLPAGGTYLLDEEETFEGASIRPLTMPVLIEAESWLVVSTSVGSIRRLATPGSKRRALQDEDERVNGVRPDQSRECVKQVLEDPEGNGLVVEQRSAGAVTDVTPVNGEGTVTSAAAVVESSP